MATIFSRISTQVPDQLPDFIQTDHPDYVAFIKAYYEFLESAELKLFDMGAVDTIIQETGINQFLIMEDTNRYRTGEFNKIVIEDYDTTRGPVVRGRQTHIPSGAFKAGDVIMGEISKATAIIKAEDINNGQRLFITPQNKFILNETVVGQQSGATAKIESYTENVVQSMMHLLDHKDADDSIEIFFNKFKESFMKTIPDILASGINKRNLLKNIKDLYRSKGTSKGHELFFRILLNENAELYYPTKDMLRISSGIWTNDSIMRVYNINSTFLMENSTETSGHIFILMEDGSQLLAENSVEGKDNLRNLVGKVITQKPSLDTSIQPGGPYYGLGYKDTPQASALVDNVLRYKYNQEDVTELVLEPNSQIGEFISGHHITAIAEEDTDLLIKAKVNSILSEADQHSLEYQSSQYFSSSDKLSVESNVGYGGVADIVSITSGTIDTIIVSSEGAYYAIGDNVVVDNTGTNGIGLAGQVSIVNGGFIAEDGTLDGAYRITLEDEPGELLLCESILTFETPTGIFPIGETFIGSDSNAIGVVIENQLSTNTIIYNLVEGSFKLGETLIGENSGYRNTLVVNTSDIYVANEDDLLMTASDRIVLEGETIRKDSYKGSVIVQETETGNREVTDIRVLSKGYGYSSLPTLSIESVLGDGAHLISRGENVGTIESIDIVNPGTHYTDPEDLYFKTTTNFLCVEVSDNFILEEIVTGLTSGATAVFKEFDVNTGVFKMNDLSVIPFVIGETIQGNSSGETANIDSYTRTNIPAKIGTSVHRAGRYLGEDGFISEASKKIQDSYYYQDYSYVINTPSSIHTWRDDLLSTVHPTGWALFGQIDIATVLSVPSKVVLLSESGAAFLREWISAVNNPYRSFSSRLLLTLQLRSSQSHGHTFGSTYRNLSSFMFNESMAKSEQYSIDFRGHNVYPLGIRSAKLPTDIDDSVSTISVGDSTKYASTGSIQIEEELIDYTGKTGTELTGCVRGQYGTLAASHLTGEFVLFVEWALSQNDVFGYRFKDWEVDFERHNITMGDLIDTPNRKNNILPPTEITLFKT